MKKILLPTFFAVFTSYISAQNLFVHSIEDEQIAFTIDENLTITFGDGVILVNQTAFQIAEINYLTFIGTPPTGIVGVNLEDNKILIFPNPVRDELTILVQNHTAGMTYQIFDMVGRSITSGPMTQSATQINMQNFVPGTYILRVEQHGKIVQTFQITKQ